MWRRDDLIEGIDTGVEWEPAQRLHNPSSGQWVRLARANGERGWAREVALLTYFTDTAPQAAPPAPAMDPDEYVDECE